MSRPALSACCLAGALRLSQARHTCPRQSALALADRLYVWGASRVSRGATRGDRLCELNVVEQVKNVCHTTIVQDAWANRQPISVHGLIYGLKDGLLRDLAVRVANPEQLEAIYRMRMGEPSD